MVAASLAGPRRVERSESAKDKDRAALAAVGTAPAHPAFPSPGSTGRGTRRTRSWRSRDQGTNRSCSILRGRWRTNA